MYRADWKVSVLLVCFITLKELLKIKEIRYNKL